MAVGDILAVEVGADGWYVDITVAGVGVGGTYVFGLGAGNDPAIGNPKVALTVTSLGFDNTGAATTLVRTVFGTAAVRQVYPNQALKQETVVGSDVKVRVALSEPIFAKDKAGAGNSGTDVTATILAGFYTQGTANNAATVTATNSSTVAYPKVVGNWTWPHNDLVGAAITLRAVAFHASAQQGRPVRCVKFTATDAHTNTVSATLTTPTVDSSVGDAVPVVEYVAALSTTALTQGDVVTVNFVAYPWIGDAGAVLDSSTGTPAPSSLVGPRSVVCDKTGGYGQSFATVDPAVGNDGTGQVVASGLPTLPYATIAAAYNALRTFNNANYGRNNCGGSTIYLTNGNHPWMGGAVTVGTAPSAWLTITKHPSATLPVISSQSGAQGAGLLLKISGVKFTAQSAAGVIAPAGAAIVWWDNITVDCPTSNQPPVYAAGTSILWHVTRCAIVNLAQGLRPFSTTNTAMGVTRGNTITDTAGTNVIFATTFVGNLKTGLGAGFSIFDTLSGQTIPTPTNTVVAYNRMTYGLASNAGLVLRMGTLTESWGLAVVQNVFENSASGTVGALFQIAADSSTGTPVDNVLMWHNTVVGQRVNIAYNDLNAVAYERRCWSIKNNIVDDWNIKADTFDNPSTHQNAARVGNWPVLFGTGASGNLDVEATGIGAPGNFLFEYGGLKSDQPAISAGSAPPASTTRAPSYPVFAARRSFDGTTAGVGGGDYHIDGSSPAVGLPRDWLLPFDIGGSARAAGDGAGAFVPSVSAAQLTAGFFGAV